VTLEDTVFAHLDLSGRRIASICGSNLLFDRVCFANCDLRGAIVSPAQAMDLARFLEVVVK
jgi:uncharacterized protein YjbI with pentapeptide repeats